MQIGAHHYRDVYTDINKKVYHISIKHINNKHLFLFQVHSEVNSERLKFLSKF